MNLLPRNLLSPTPSTTWCGLAVGAGFLGVAAGLVAVQAGLGVEAGLLGVQAGLPCHHSAAVCVHLCAAEAVHPHSAPTHGRGGAVLHLNAPPHEHQVCLQRALSIHDVHVRPCPVAFPCGSHHASGHRDAATADRAAHPASDRHDEAAASHDRDAAAPSADHEDELWVGGRHGNYQNLAQNHHEANVGPLCPRHHMMANDRCHSDESDAHVQGWGLPPPSPSARQGACPAQLPGQFAIGLPRAGSQSPAPAAASPWYRRLSLHVSSAPPPGDVYYARTAFSARRPALCC
mmetsp:Transcript_6749/g.11492  ORF Transcript_6749/g.11492 Transcript_6749/m.11492 type:complete len:290 (+) Transcript_6749:551-1420(+)